MFLLWLRQLPWCWDCIPASVPQPAEGRSSPTSTPVFPPSSFILPSFAWFYIVFSTGQVLLSAPSWCSACASVSEGVFLMYLWRELYSMSTYSSAILFLPQVLGVFLKQINFGEKNDKIKWYISEAGVRATTLNVSEFWILGALRKLVVYLLFKFLWWVFPNCL